MKVLHLPTTVGGNPQGISNHLNQIGVESSSWSFQGNYLNYDADKKILSDNDGLFVAEIKRLYALRYIFIYDVVFFNYGSTLFRPICSGPKELPPMLQDVLVFIYSAYAALMQRIELGLLSMLNRVLFVQYQGDDARQGDYCLKNFEISIAGHVDAGYYNHASDDLKRKQVALLDKYCHKIYALNPDLLYVLPSRAEFLPYSHINLSEWTPVYSQMENRPLRIGHAPSHRGVKGTDKIICAVDSLRSEGYDFEFVLIEGMSNKDAKNCYKNLDVVVDQLFAGWYGGLAVECMALGKPVLTYIREDDLKFIPLKMKEELPVLKITSSTIKHDLKRVLDMPREELYELAMRCRCYVEKWHDPLKIAQRIKHDILEAKGRLDNEM